MTQSFAHSQAGKTSGDSNHSRKGRKPLRSSGKQKFGLIPSNKLHITNIRNMNYEENNIFFILIHTIQIREEMKYK